MFALQRWLAMLALCMLWPSPLLADPSDIDLIKEVSIGVLAFRSKEQTLAEWQPTADYLSRRIPSHRFVIKAMDFQELEALTENGNADFILTNTSHYVLLEKKFHITRIATLIRSEQGEPLKSFGGVIVTRAGNGSINSIKDLRGKKIATVDTKSLGGYQVQAVELEKQGLRMPSDVELNIVGMPHDAAIQALMSNKADAAFARTGILESMVAEKKLRLADLKPIEPRSNPEFKLLHSTGLYPEWPFAATRSASESLANKVTIALLELQHESDAAHAGHYYGWAIPADYQVVHTLLSTLRLPPYDVPVEFGLRDVLSKYRVQIAIFGALSALLLFMYGRSIKLNLRLQEKTQQLETEASARRKAEDDLRLQARVFENSLDGIVITDMENRIERVNQAFSEITGYLPGEVIGQNPSILSSGIQDKLFYQQMWQALAMHGQWRGEVWNLKKSGEFYAEILNISVLKGTEGKVTHYIGIFTDITDIKNVQAKLESLAHFDALTKLPNRFLLADRLHQAIISARRKDELLAVGFMDLDGFKPINDHHGHEIGDRLLIDVARRLNEAVRAGDTVARLGGDEFVLLLTGFNDMAELDPVLGRILAATAAPFKTGAQELQVTASIGITVFPLDSSDQDTLLRHADLAMYDAKQAGRNRFHMFDPALDQQAQSRHHQLERIRQALQQNELRLHYQPKVNLRTGQVVGMEALLRWLHPEQGLISPAEFLPLAEQSELIVDIGEWVTDQALRQIYTWQQAGLIIPVSINIAGRQLQQPEFLNRLDEILARYPEVSSTLLELEILETSALEILQCGKTVISACDRLGVSFALDDFGTGYSSLSYLKQLPAQTLKIDQTFVRDMLDDPEDLAIVEGVVSLAKIFKRNIVAEGVETPEHGVLLLRINCDVAQGYGISRPMPAEQVADWIAEYKPDKSWKLWSDKLWNRADLPLLIAELEHTRWVNELIRAVEEDTDPHLRQDEVSDHRKCRFGHWYQSHGQMNYGHLSEFTEIDAIHEQVHQLGIRMLELRQNSQIEGARALIPQLQNLRERAIEKLARLHAAVAMEQ